MSYFFIIFVKKMKSLLFLMLNTFVVLQLFSQSFSFKLQYPETDYPQFSASIPGFWNSVFVVADIDYDGDDDIIVGERTDGGGRNTNTAGVYLNDGVGNFQLDSGNFSPTDNCENMVLLDINNDSILDIYYEGRLFRTFYINDGKGKLTKIDGYPFDAKLRNLVFGDIDNDGDLDVYSEGTGKDFSINDGELNFTQVNAGRGFYKSIAGTTLLKDVDGDGDLDLFKAGYNNQYPSYDFTHLFLNDSGIFSREYAGFANVSGDALIEDFDLDGNMDILISGQTEHGNDTTILYFQDSMGGFHNDSLNQWLGVLGEWVSVEDLDSDGDLDLIFMNVDYPQYEGSTVIFRNNGKGLFNHDSNFSFFRRTRPIGIYANADTLLDLLFLGSGGAEILQNFGNTTYVAAEQSTITGFYAPKHKAIDFDLDGDLDLFMMGKTRFDNADFKYYENDGTGLFKEIEISALKGLSYGDFDIGDVTGNGLLDIIMIGARFESTYDRHCVIYENKGNFQFTENESLRGFNYAMVNLVDIDGDGDLDVLETGTSQFIGYNLFQIYLNNGKGEFTLLEDHGIPGVANGGLYHFDYDNDGDQDVLVTGSFDRGTYGHTAKLYENNGHGIFVDTETPELDEIGTKGNVQIADINNDGYQDIVFLIASSRYDTPSILLNQKGSGFTALNDSNFSAGQSVLADFDGDRDLDLYFVGSNHYPGQSNFMENLGNGEFQQVHLDGFEKFDRNVSAISADFNGDELNDLIIMGFVTNQMQASYFYKNTGCQKKPWPYAVSTCYKDSLRLGAKRNGSNYVWNSGETSDSLLVYTEDQATFAVNYTTDLGCARIDSFIVKPIACEGQMKIQGLLYVDYDNDGKYNKTYGDYPIPNVGVVTGGTKTYSDTSGYFSFFSEGTSYNQYYEYTYSFDYNYNTHSSAGYDYEYDLYSYGFEETDTLFHRFNTSGNYDVDLEIVGGITDLIPGEKSILNVSLINHYEYASGITFTIQLRNGVTFDETQADQGLSITKYSNTYWKVYANRLERFEKENFQFKVKTLDDNGIIGNEVCIELECETDIDYFDEEELNYGNNEYSLCATITDKAEDFHKECLEGDGLYSKNKSSIAYQIRFQNTTSDTVSRIVVIDTLDPAFFRAEMYSISTSHYSTVLITGKVVKWVFEDIMLPPSSEDELKSIVYINFTDLLKWDRSYNDPIYNTAHVYFDDAKQAMKTNRAENYYEIPTAVDAVVSTQNYIYPAILSSGEVINIQSEEDLAGENIEIYNTLGKVVYSLNNGVSGTKVSFNIPNLAKGVFYIRVGKDMHSALIK